MPFALSFVARPRLRRLGWLALIGLAALSLAPNRASAHSIESSLERLQSLQESLALQSQFSSGEPTSDAVVRLVPPDGTQPIDLGRTDSQGRLSFVLPKGATGTWELQVDGGPGHRDYLELPLRNGQPQLDQISESPAPAHFPLGMTLLLLGGCGSLGWLLRAARPGFPRRR